VITIIYKVFKKWSSSFEQHTNIIKRKHKEERNKNLKQGGCVLDNFL
jgi:hypothetical protein